MAYRVEESRGNTDIVIDGWEQGIGSSPYVGISNIKNANIISVPGEVSVNFSTSALNKPPVVEAVAFTSTDAGDLITVSDATGYYNGMAITLNTVVTSTGIVTGRVYWIGSLSGNSFQLHKNPSRGDTAVAITTDGSGTLTSYVLGKPIDDTIAYDATDIATTDRNHFYLLDENGLVWWIDSTGGIITSNLVYLGNDDVASSPDGGRGIAIWKSFIIVFRNGDVDALDTGNIETNTDFDGLSGWEYDFFSSDNVLATPRAILVGQDDILYFANRGGLGSLSENIGSNFDPQTPSTFTVNSDALDLPQNDEVSSLGFLGIFILIGGIQDKVYPWDRLSSSFNLPIILPEDNTTHILSRHSTAYMFTGSRGRIYVTNGSIAELYKKIPDHITGKDEPYFSIDSAAIARDQIYFGFTPTENDGTAIAGLDGVWAIDINTAILRRAHTLSHNTDGTVTTISKYPLSPTPNGTGILAGWEDSTGKFGLDEGSSNPYTGGETVIDSDIIPIGTFSFKETIASIEFKLGKPLVAGESIELQQRSNLAEAFASIGTNNEVGVISGSFDANFQEVQWLEIRAILKSTNTNPSFVPLREIRIRL